MNQNLHESMVERISQLKREQVSKTILFADLYGSTEYKLNHVDIDWVALMANFYSLAIKAIQDNKGELVKFIGDAVMAAFDNAGAALSAAIAIQESIEDQLGGRQNPILPCKIGIATGNVFTYPTPDGKGDYLGTTVDIAARLAEEARGFAILLSSKTFQAADVTQVRSRAGELLRREPEEYFGDRLANEKMKGIKDVVYYYSLWWQARKEFVDDKPAGQAPVQGEASKMTFGEASKTTFVAPPPPSLPQGLELGRTKRYRGVVERITPNAYGWINLPLAGGHVESIWFHVERMADRKMPNPGDAVHFFVREREDGKKQAHSVFRIGSEMQGRLLRFNPGDQFGFVTTRDEEGQEVSIYFTRYDISDLVKKGDEVTFKISENPRGLKAIEIKPLRGAETEAASEPETEE